METFIYIGIIIGIILFISGMAILPKTRRYLYRGNIVETGGGKSKRSDIGLYMAIAGFLLLIIFGVIGGNVLGLW